jgi:LPPG:FO 2-phospho-L-lactate transferase
LAALAAPDLDCVVVCPSNPYLSVDPILAVPGMRQALAECQAPVVAVSPILGGQAVKGPAAKIMRELGVPASQSAIARHYAGLIGGLDIDESDAGEAAELDVAVELAPTLMRSLEDRERLARRVLGFAQRLGAPRS